jgi:chromosome segregation ATPase
MNDHKDAVRISKQPEGTYDHRAVLNLKACYLEVVAQLEAATSLAKMYSQELSDERKARDLLQIKVDELTTEIAVEKLRTEALRKDYNELIMALAAAQEWPPITPEETARGIAAAQEVRK